MTWRQATREALCGPEGFYRRGERPARHFRTSAHVSPRFAVALLRLLREVDAALGHPAELDLVDVGAGGGELLGQLLAAADQDPALAGRLAVRAVEVAPRPPGADPRIRWLPALPRQVTGMVIANEWLDNVPLDVAELTPRGPRLMLVHTRTGQERAGPPPTADDLAWLREWWPLARPGDRAEIGRPRSQAWADVVDSITRGLAVAADYAHQRDSRPADGTIAGYRAGRPVAAIPDGDRDVTAHVALDACAEAGRRAGASATLLTTQRAALRALGLTGRRPALSMASADPLGYAQALQRAGEEAELTDPAGLGSFGFLAQSVGMDLPPALAGLVGALPLRAPAPPPGTPVETPGAPAPLPAGGGAGMRPS